MKILSLMLVSALTTGAVFSYTSTQDQPGTTPALNFEERALKTRLGCTLEEAGSSTDLRTCLSGRGQYKGEWDLLSEQAKQ